MKKRICFALLSIALFSSIAAARAEDSPIQQDSLYSHLLNEKRALQVILPKGYKPGSPDKYNVLYVLDGETITPYAARTYSLLQGEEFLPELIIVGIPNMNLGFRERDFTPTHVSGLSGGADKFLAFLKSELIPYIEKTYPAKADGNTLYGGSLAGLFVLIGRHAPQYGLLRSESLRYASDCR